MSNALVLPKHRELLQGFDTVPGVDRPISVTRGLQDLRRQSNGEVAAAATGRAHRRGSSRFGLTARRGEWSLCPDSACPLRGARDGALPRQRHRERCIDE